MIIHASKYGPLKHEVEFYSSKLVPARFRQLPYGSKVRVSVFYTARFRTQSFRLITPHFESSRINSHHVPYIFKKRIRENGIIPLFQSVS